MDTKLVPMEIESNDDSSADVLFTNADKVMTIDIPITDDTM